MMAKNLYQIIIISVSGLLILLPFFPGCNTFEKNAGNAWVIDPNNYFHTNDEKRAQQEIPFTIVLPKYLPDILGSDYAFQIDGPIKNDNFKEVEVEISYVKENHIIFINEQNVRLIMEPNEALEPVFHDIAGVRVLRQKSYLYGDQEKIEGLRFDWNQNVLTLAVRIFSLGEEEGLKVVESMIKQIK